MAQYIFYSKSTCITCQKAKAFLQQHQINFDEMDIIKNPPPRKLLEAAVDAGNVKASLNSRSAMYKRKKLGEKTPDQKTAIDLMLQDPNLIRRPLIVKNGVKNNRQIFLGLDSEALEKFLKS